MGWRRMGYAGRGHMSRKQSCNGGMWNPRHVGPFDTVLRTGRYADVAKLGRPVAEQIEIGDRYGNATFTGCTVCVRNNVRSWHDASTGRDFGLSASVQNRLMRQLSDAVSRCTNPKVKSWPHYGGRGVSVFWLWRGKGGTRNFIEYVSTLPNFDNPAFEMDRKDNDGNYEPGNIRFISRQANMLNRRKINDLEIIRVGLRFAGLWPTEPLYDTYAVGALSFGT